MQSKFLQLIIYILSINNIFANNNSVNISDENLLKDNLETKKSEYSTPECSTIINEKNNFSNEKKLHDKYIEFCLENLCNKLVSTLQYRIRSKSQSSHEIRSAVIPELIDLCKQKITTKLLQQKKIDNNFLQQQEIDLLNEALNILQKINNIKEKKNHILTINNFTIFFVFNDKYETTINKYIKEYIESYSTNFKYSFRDCSNKKTKEESDFFMFLDKNPSYENIVHLDTINKYINQLSQNLLKKLKKEEYMQIAMKIIKKENK